LKEYTMSIDNRDNRLTNRQKECIPTKSNNSRGDLL
jgi:hypothetical protein